VIELDLDHLTTAGRARLAELVGVDSPSYGQERRIDRAFALVADAAAGWQTAPDAKQQAELHREIARLYGNEAPAWRDRLGFPTELSAAELTGQVRRGAEHVLAMLPDPLNRKGRWKAAGAMAGALGCIAAATLLSPAAIASLPIWSALGAAVAAVVPGGDRAAHAEAAERPGGVDLAGAVRAAALFALLLELQGRGEAAISRILDATLGDEDVADAVLDDARAVSRWLDEVRHRYDVALIGEARA
jgi:hypothetical protein